MFGAILLTVMGCNDYSLVERPDVIINEDTGLVVPPTVVPPADAPIAECSVSPNPVSPPFEVATWDGSGSYDPGGLAITSYNWTLLSKPAGSAVDMPPGDAVRGNFMPDQAGTYVGQLIVTNEAGIQSAPCTTNLEAIPAQDLWVEMFWDRAGDDMDLHLLAPGGTPRTGTDCYFVNCDGGAVLDWGATGYAGDNPRLDLDDIPGTGPENINIDDPDASGGGFTVFVHDYPGDGGEPTNVTVNIYLNGSLTWSDTRTITGEDTDTYFAQIDWNAGTVTGL